MKTLIAVFVAFSFSSCTSMGVRFYEQADYEILHQEEVLEVRQYPELLVAETSVNLSYQESYEIAFQRLAKYVGGENVVDLDVFKRRATSLRSPGQNITMKVPFVVNKTTSGWTMQFVLPAEYSKQSIPKPIDPNIQIKEIPARKVGVVRYTGSPDVTNMKEETKILLAWLEDRRYDVTSSPRSAFYDTNEVLPMFRRNEVHVDVN